MYNKLIRLIVIISVVFNFIGCSYPQKTNIEIQQSGANICSGLQYDYILNENSITVINKQTKSKNSIIDDNIVCIYNIDDILYYVTEKEMIYTLKKVQRGEVVDVYSIPIENIEWCDICQNILYLYSNNSLYSINLDNPGVRLIAEDVEAQHLSVSDGYIYYNEAVINVSDDLSIESMLKAYVGQKINKVNIETGEISNLFSKIEPGYVYYIEQIVACPEGILFYLSGGDTYKKSVFLVDDNSKIRLLKSNIDTDIDYLAIDEQNFYYVDTEMSKIMSISLNSKNEKEILYYGDYNIKNVFGMTDENIYMLNAEGNIISVERSANRDVPVFAHFG